MNKAMKTRQADEDTKLTVRIAGHAPIETTVGALENLLTLAMLRPEGVWEID